MEAAFKLADAEGSSVLVESYIRGNEHRVLVVGGPGGGRRAWRGRLGSAVTASRPCAELIDSQINTDPRRGLTEDFPLNRITLGEDPVVLLDLQRQGFDARRPCRSPAGKGVLIQRNGNVAIDCTAEVHPEVAHAVSLAARTVVGLDIAGVDLVTEDISKPHVARPAAPSSR